MTEGRRNVVDAVKRVAARLGNTPAVCRKAYIHPTVLETYLGGRLAELADGKGGKAAWAVLADEEAALMKLLLRHAESLDDLGAVR
jgi:DNA topoisomerase-1